MLWHFLPNGPYSFNLFIFFNFHKLFGIKKTLLGRLASTYEDDKASRNGGDSKISFKSTEVKRSKDKFLFVQNFLYTVSKPFIGYYLGKFQKLIFYNQTSLQFSFKPKVLGKKLRLLYAGSLNDRKRPQKAILMAKHLNNLESDYQLDIVGDGYLKEELIKMTKKNELSEKIIFHGSLPKSRIAKFYQKAHFLISFSSAEVFTHTLLESWATGTIFLGSDTPENIEMVGKDYGLIVDPSDGCELKSLAERISQMTQKEFDKIILRSLVESKKYHWPVVIDKYSQLIKELLSP